MCGKIGTLIYYGGNVKWQSLLGKLYGSSLKIENRMTILFSNFTSGHIFQRDLKQGLRKYLNIYVLSNIIHNS